MRKRQVTMKEFFQHIGHRDVNPHIVGSWDKEIGGYFTEWRLRGGATVGITLGSEFGGEKQRSDTRAYFIVE